MTVTDVAAYQYNATKTTYTGNLQAVNSLQRSASITIENRFSSSQVNEVSRSNSDELQFLNQYKSKMDGLKSAADRLRSLSKDGVWSNLQITSSNESVVSNATNFGKIPLRAEYDIDVKQLAKRQINTIEAPSGGFTDGTFQIESTNGGNITGSASIQIDTHGGTASQEDIMNDIVNQINRQQDLGVRASIVEKDGSSVIQLQRDETGDSKKFTVTGVQSTVEQASQDLVYSVNGAERTSGSNHGVQLDPDGANKFLRVNFDSVGKATLKSDVNVEKLQKYTEKFVDAYNATIDFLVDNAHRGSGVSKTLDRFMQSPLSPDAMKMIGLHFGEDGKISFDEDEFKQAAARDTRMVYDILSDNYSVADTIYQKASKASTRSVTSLLDNSKLKGNGGITIINNYYNYSPFVSPFGYPLFGFGSSLFFSAKI